jgi:iron complex outermembrane receptor protein
MLRGEILMKKRNLQKKIAFVFTAFCLTIPALVYAEDNSEFMLDPVVVTALRHETSDLNTPASIKVYTKEQLAATGAASLIEALKFTEGVSYYSLGPGGQSYGGMTSKLVMRGIESGTLVLLNGIPINLNGKYNLEDIPVSQVERVEIVKGAGSVLYGSEAMGGVINIITKQTRENSISVAAGNSGVQDHGFSMQEGKAGFSFNYQKMGESDQISSPSSDSKMPATGGSVNLYTALGESEKKAFSWNYKFDDHLTLTHMYTNNDYAFLRKQAGTDILFKTSAYDDTKNFVQLDYTQGNWKSKVFLNNQDLDYNGVEYPRANKPEWGKTNNRVWGLDTQKAWNSDNGNVLAGINYQRESYEDIGVKLDGKYSTRNLAAYTTGPYARDHFSTYMQWDKPISLSTRLILSAREDVLHSEVGKNFNEFSPQFQTLTKIDEHSMWYTNIGKTFKMPTFTQMYAYSDLTASNPGLKPETGYNYEVGWKKAEDSHSLKVAVFHTTVTDQITWNNIGTTAAPQYQAQNSDFRNTGIEVSYENQLSPKFTYSIGGTYSNPEEQDGDLWQRIYGRIQLSGALTYTAGKTGATLSAQYLGNRVDSTLQTARKAMLPVTLAVKHRYDEDHMLTFTVENLLDRQDITSHSTTEYYTLPRTYKIGMVVNF